MAIHPTDRWTVYGYVDLGHAAPGPVGTTRPTRKGFHLDRCHDPEAAKAFLVAGKLEHGPKLVAVIVHLKGGNDMASHREVVYRTTPDARAWWE